MHTTTYGRSPREKLLAAGIGDALAVVLGADLNRKESFEDFRHLPAAEVCGDELARLTGRRLVVNERMRLQEVREVVDPDPSAPGRLRRAEPEDADLVTSWFDRFAGD